MPLKKKKKFIPTGVVGYPLPTEKSGQIKYNKGVKVLFILSLFLSFNGHAINCPNIRLDKNFPQNSPPDLLPKAPKINKAKHLTMATVPVQDQDLSICYAHSAAQMVDAVRHKEALLEKKEVDNKVSSAVYLAVNSKNAWNKDGVYFDEGQRYFPFERGLLCDAFAAARKKGTCPKEHLDIFFDMNKLSEEDFFQKLLEIEQNLAIEKYDIYKMYEEDILNIWNTEPLDFKETKPWNDFNNHVKACEKRASYDLYNEFKKVFGDAFKINRIIFNTFFDVEMFDSSKDLSRIFNLIICPRSKRIKLKKQNRCHEYSSKNVIKSKVKYPFSKKIISSLSAKSLPVGISYCSNILTKDDEYQGIDIDKKSGNVTLRKNQQDLDDCRAHSSLVIGSRFNKKTKSCEMLIRNSWGYQCSAYKKYYPSKTMVKMKNTDRSVNQFDVKCEDGNIWVDHKKLEKNTFRVEHL